MSFTFDRPWYVFHLLPIVYARISSSNDLSINEMDVVFLMVRNGYGNCWLFSPAGHRDGLNKSKNSSRAQNNAKNGLFHWLNVMTTMRENFVAIFFFYFHFVILPLKWNSLGKWSIFFCCCCEIQFNTLFIDKHMMCEMSSHLIFFFFFYF